MMKNVLLIVVSILFITTASAQENRIKVACIGNSITYGYGLPDYTIVSGAITEDVGRVLSSRKLRQIGYYLVE